MRHFSSACGVLPTASLLHYNTQPAKNTPSTCKTMSLFWERGKRSPLPLTPARRKGVQRAPALWRMQGGALPELEAAPRPPVRRTRFPSASAPPAAPPGSCVRKIVSQNTIAPVQASGAASILKRLCHLPAANGKQRPRPLLYIAYDVIVPNRIHA